ncbi:hypothetical protein GN956_G30 [Arapaima gigas]
MLINEHLAVRSCRGHARPGPQVIVDLDEGEAAEPSREERREGHFAGGGFQPLTWQSEGSLLESRCAAVAGLTEAGLTWGSWMFAVKDSNPLVGASEVRTENSGLAHTVVGVLLNPFAVFGKRCRALVRDTGLRRRRRRLQALYYDTCPVAVDPFSHRGGRSVTPATACSCLLSQTWEEGEGLPQRPMRPGTGNTWAWMKRDHLAIPVLRSPSFTATAAGQRSFTRVRFWPPACVLSASPAAIRTHLRRVSLAVKAMPELRPHEERLLPNCFVQVTKSLL